MEMKTFQAMQTGNTDICSMFQNAAIAHVSVDVSQSGFFKGKSDSVTVVVMAAMLPHSEKVAGLIPRSGREFEAESASLEVRVPIHRQSKDPPYVHREYTWRTSISQNALCLAATAFS